VREELEAQTAATPSWEGTWLAHDERIGFEITAVQPYDAATLDHLGSQDDDHSDSSTITSGTRMATSAACASSPA
jgi:hypothetical protein